MQILCYVLRQSGIWRFFFLGFFFSPCHETIAVTWFAYGLLVSVAARSLLRSASISCLEIRTPGTDIFFVSQTVLSD